MCEKTGQAIPKSQMLIDKVCVKSRGDKIPLLIVKELKIANIVQGSRRRSLFPWKELILFLKAIHSSMKSVMLKSFSRLEMVKM